MKCIRKTVDDLDVIRRVPDDDAARHVRCDGWHYTTKGAWKAAGRPRRVARRKRRPLW